MSAPKEIWAKTHGVAVIFPGGQSGLVGGWDEAGHRGGTRYVRGDVAADLLEALEELLIDVAITQNNMRDAAKTDARWAGCAEAIQPRVDAARAAIAKAEGGEA